MTVLAVLMPAPGGSLSRLLAAMVLGISAYLSLTPQPPSPAGLPDHSDLIVHVVMHMALAGSVFLSLPGLGWARWGVCLALAVGFEVAQLWIPGRTFDVLDLGANILGALVGGSSMLWLLLRRTGSC